MNKQVFEFQEIKDRVFSGLDKLTQPVASTLSPKGSTVVYEDKVGNQFYTKDGFTIAKNIFLSDEVENATVEIVKGSSFKTNQEAGDGTSTTILLSNIFVREGSKLIDDNVNRVEIVKEFNRFTDEVVKNLSKQKKEAKTDKELLNIAKISAANDGQVAKDVLQIVKTAGIDGQVIIDRGFAPGTEIIEDSGFVLDAGMFAQELTNSPNGAFADYKDVPVLVTDKRLYYQQEAETILGTCIDAGYDSIVIVAQDFIGEALPFFIANHKHGKIKVLLVKDSRVTNTKNETLEDLSVYLGGEVISEKSGSIVDNLKIENFSIAKRVFSDGTKTVIARDKNEPNPELLLRIEGLKKELKKNGDKESPDYKEVQRRISTLTNGMVTIKVGGRTGVEVIEILHRYEDAINATRAAMKDGYLIGGGLALHNAVKGVSCDSRFASVFKAISEINIRTIAENSGKDPRTVLERIEELSVDNPNMGFNALTGEYEDLLEAGVIDPYKVTEMAIQNAVSIANVIIGSKYFIINELEDNNG